MKQPIVKSFLQFINENVEQPQLDSSQFLIELADRIQKTEKFGIVSVEGTYLQISKSDNIHDWADIRDAANDVIRVYADYEAKVMPLFKDQSETNYEEINVLAQHGILELSTFLKGFAISSSLNCWSKDLDGWSMDDGSDEMEEYPLDEFNLKEGDPIETIARELSEYIDDGFNQFYTAEDVIQDSVNDYCNQYSDDEEEDESDDD